MKLSYILVTLTALEGAAAWVASSATSPRPFVTQSQPATTLRPAAATTRLSPLFSSTEKEVKASTPKKEQEDLPYDYEEPEDAVIHIKPRAMNRLRELRAQQLKDNTNEMLVLRMGVRNGGCSGMSYVMDFDTPDSIDEEDGDTVDTYEGEGIQCVVDSKSLLYLYGLELDYSNELVGGGFRFQNPNAEESCGCGSSFAV